MRIDRLDVRLCRLPLAHFFETSFGRIYDRTFLLVRLEGDGHEGWGEARRRSASRTTAPRPPRRPGTSSRSSSRRASLGQTFEHPRDIFPALARVRGHNMAKAARGDGGLGSLRAHPGQAARRPCSAARATRIASGVSIGIQDSLDQLVAKVEQELAAGYQRIKIKIKPGWDLDAVEARARDVSATSR